MYLELLLYDDKLLCVLEVGNSIAILLRKYIFFITIGMHLALLC